MPELSTSIQDAVQGVVDADAWSLHGAVDRLRDIWEGNRTMPDDKYGTDQDAVRNDTRHMVGGQLMTTADEIEHLRYALQWALAYIGNGSDCPEDGESFDDYCGATRLAWPHNPEQWA